MNIRKLEQAQDIRFGCILFGPRAQSTVPHGDSEDEILPTPEVDQRAAPVMADCECLTRFVTFRINAPFSIY